MDTPPNTQGPVLVKFNGEPVEDGYRTVLIDIRSILVIVEVDLGTRIILRPDVNVMLSDSYLDVIHKLEQIMEGSKQ